MASEEVEDEIWGEDPRFEDEDEPELYDDDGNYLGKD